MIIWTVTGGESGSADTLRRAAAEAVEAAATWLDDHAPAQDVGDHLPAATVCVGESETRMPPVYDRAHRYDSAATRRGGHHLVDQLAADLPESPSPATGPAQGTRHARI